MTLRPYRTLMRQGESEYVINKSRFIGYGAPCADEPAALNFLQQIRTRHKDATHNCYAYVIGVNQGIMRYSDDGEPGGTAGLPIIEVIRRQQVTNCCVVVTRYFGGVLLGAGGLTRAYAHGASQALSASIVGDMHPTARYMLDLPYPLLGRVEHHLKDQPVVVEDKAFTDRVTLTLIVKCAQEEALLEGIVAATEGRAEAIRLDEEYMPWQTV